MRLTSTMPARLAAGVLAGALLLTGCSSSSDSDGKSGSTGKKAATDAVASGLINVSDAGTPQKGGTLVVAEYTEARSMDPTRTAPNGGSGGSAMLAVYDSLMRYDETDLTFKPQLAESLSSNDDSTEWTLKLREGVEFTDGTPLDADAVVASIARFVTKNGIGTMQWKLMGTEVEKVDDLTVKFTTEHPWARLDNMLATGPGMILAPAAYADEENFTPIGAGPFTFVEYRPAEHLLVKANKDYFDGAPYLDEIKFVWPTGDQAKYDAVANGDADTTLMRTRTPVDQALEAKLPAMRWLVGQGRAIFVNRAEGRAASMPEVRDAMNLAFDPVALAGRINEDPSLATKSLFPESSPWSTGVEPVAQDIEAAKAKFAEAKAKGFDGKIELMHQADPASQAAGVAVKAQLDLVGFDVQLKPVSSIADLVKAMYVDHNYDMAFSSVGMRDGDPALRMTATMHSTAPENAWAYKNPEVDELLMELAAARSPEEGADTMKSLETIWQADPPVLGMTTGTWLQPWNKNVHGISPSAEMLVLYNKAWKES